MERRIGHWLLGLLALILLGVLRGIAEGIGGEWLGLALPAALLAVWIVLAIRKQREAKRTALAEGRPWPPPSQHPLAEERPAFTNRAIATGFTSGCALAMALLLAALYASEHGIPLPMNAILWTAFLAITAAEVWVFLEYARRVNARIATRSLAMPLRLVFCFAFIEIIAASFTLMIGDNYDVSKLLTAAWLFGGLILSAALAGLALWLTRDVPMEHMGSTRTGAPPP